MQDILVIKEYLKSHGVDNVLDLTYDEILETYEKTVKEGVSYYNNILQEWNPEEVQINLTKPNISAAIKDVKTIEDLYKVLYEFLHSYSPTDLIAFMSEIKMIVPYGRLQKIIAIVHARIQDELLDGIKYDLKDLPEQERETLVTHYEGMRTDIIKLHQKYIKYRNSGILEYLRMTAETKLNIMQTFLNRDLETEYKPFYDNSKEKRTLVAKILEISGIYTKKELFDMKISELKVTYDEIMAQVMQKEREQKLMRKYIEIFEDSAGITEAEFKSHCKEMQRNLSDEIINEIIGHFTTRNHFIANKINNVLSGKSMNKQISASALLEGG